MSRPGHIQEGFAPLTNCECSRQKRNKKCVWCLYLPAMCGQWQQMIIGILKT